MEKQRTFTIMKEPPKSMGRFALFGAPLAPLPPGDRFLPYRPLTRLAGKAGRLAGQGSRTLDCAHKMPRCLQVST